MNATLPILGVFLALLSAQPAFAQAAPQGSPPQGSSQTNNASAEQEVIKLSKDKWQWMAERSDAEHDPHCGDRADVLAPRAPAGPAGRGSGGYPRPQAG